jgi:hypothetical protein
MTLTERPLALDDILQQWDHIPVHAHLTEVSDILRRELHGLFRDSVGATEPVPSLRGDKLLDERTRSLLETLPLILESTTSSASRIHRRGRVQRIDEARLQTTNAARHTLTKPRRTNTTSGIQRVDSTRKGHQPVALLTLLAT